MPTDAKTARVLEFLERRATDHEALGAQYRRLIRVLRGPAPDAAPPDDAGPAP